jgi:chloramphenicol 3-O phosphotransferase
MDQGNVVLLNGTSSAGKTSIARALQEVMATPYLHSGIDHFLPRLPPQFTLTSDGVTPATSDYFLLVYRDGGTARTVTDRPEGTAVYSSGVLTEVRIGPGGVRVLAGMYRAIAALAATGIDVVVDDCIYDRRVLAAAVEALRGTDVLFVGLHLPRAEAERRERERGDRGPGGAAAFYDLVHTHGRYDLELDTVANSPMACALAIKQALHDGHPRRAFRDLARVGAG